MLFQVPQVVSARRTLIILRSALCCLPLNLTDAAGDHRSAQRTAPRRQILFTGPLHPVFWFYAAASIGFALYPSTRRKLRNGLRPLGRPAALFAPRHTPWRCWGNHDKCCDPPRMEDVPVQRHLAGSTSPCYWSHSLPTQSSVIV